MKKWIRNCPRCNKIVEHATEKSRDGSVKYNRKCASCGMLGKNVGKLNGFFLKQHSYDTKSRISEKNKGKIISEEQKLRISLTHKNKIVSDETKEKIRQKAIGRVHSEESKQKNREYIGDKCYWFGKTLSTEHRRKLRLATIAYNNSKYGQFYPNYNINSISILEEKAKELGIPDLQHAENGGEFYIKELGYWVDGYSKQKNIIIEYDEPYHYNKNGELNKKDKMRQTEIESHLDCKFIRIKQ